MSKQHRGTFQYWKPRRVTDWVRWSRIAFRIALGLALGSVLVAGVLTGILLIKGVPQ